MKSKNKLIMQNMSQSIHEQDVNNFLWSAISLFQSGLKDAGANKGKTTFTAKDISTFIGHIISNDKLRMSNTTSENASLVEMKKWMNDN